jgi:hypothetical protein
MDKMYSWPEKTILPAKQGVVKFPVTYRYNGGTIVKGKWYEGVLVNKPAVPAGYELVTMGIGLQLNSFPPEATMFLRKKEVE